MLWIRTFIASSIYSSISGQVLNCRTISITSAASLAIFQRMDVFQSSSIRSATNALITLRKFSLNNIKIPIMEFLLFDNNWKKELKAIAYNLPGQSCVLHSSSTLLLPSHLLPLSFAHIFILVFVLVPLPHAKEHAPMSQGLHSQ